MTYGGKGVATSFGVFMALMPLPTGIIAAIAVAIMATTGYVAIGSCVGATLLPIVGYFMASPWYLWITLPLALFINLRHLGNWSRLFAGKEPKIWDKAKLKVDEGARGQGEEAT
jgi:glycerol-3-phosphate acyltransferase PlsY